MAGRFRRTVHLGAFLVSSFLLAAASSKAAPVVDQSQTTGTHYAFGALASGGSSPRTVCQSFVPTAGDITRVDLALGTYGTYSASRDVEVFLSTGNCKGGAGAQTILSHQLTAAEYDALSGGTSQPLTKHVYHWDFPTIELAPGTTYYLGIRQLDACSGCLATHAVSPSAYASGAFRAGTWGDSYNEDSSKDLWFVTYASGLSLGPVTQYAPDGTTSVPESAVIGSDLVIKAAPTSADGSDAALEVEFRPYGTPFVGTPTHVSSLVPSGIEASVAIPLPADGLYRYRARAGDGTGDGSLWQDFGTSGNFDVEVDATPLPGVIDQSQASGAQYGFGTATNGGGTRTVCQSFVPASSEIVGVDFMVGTLGTYSPLRDVEVFLSEAGCKGEAGAQVLASHALTPAEYDALSAGTALPLPAGLFRWDTGTVPVTPGQAYYLGIRQADACQDCLATFTASENPYAAGELHTGTWTDAFAPQAGSDLWFRTHGNPPGPTPIKVAVILADLADAQHADPSTLTQPCKLLDQNRTYASWRDYYEDMFFCVNDYYDENSYGTVRFEFTLFDDGGGWYDLPGSQADYAGKTQSAIQVLRNDALFAALDDMSGQGPFAIRAVVHPGLTQVTSPLGDMWDVGYSYSASEPRGVHVSSKVGLGVWVHELGHVVGPILGFGGGTRVIPDLDISRGAIGAWDVMADGFRNGGQRNPTSFSSLTRNFLSLLGTESVAVNSTHWVTALESSGLGDAIKGLPLDGDTNFMLLEARTNSSVYSTWDTSLPEDKALVLIYGNPSADKFTIPGNGPIGQFGIDDGVLDPDTHESYLDFDNRLVVTALSDRETALGEYQIEAGVRDMAAADFVGTFIGQVLRPPTSSVWQTALTLHEQAGYALGMLKDLAPHDGSSVAYEDGPKVTPFGAGIGIALTTGGLAGLMFLLYVILSFYPKAVARLKPHVKPYERFMIISALVASVAFVTAIVFQVFYPHRAPNIIWPYTWIELAGRDEASPDLDLHVYCADGRHVGMDYATGAYDVEIADAITNGDNLGAPEWIFFPPTPENASCLHSVSARDNQAFLDANPDLASVLGSATDSYEIYARYIDPASGIFTSVTLEDQVIEPGEVILHEATGTTDITLLPGVADTEAPVTVASATGTLGLDGVTYVTDVVVRLSVTDGGSGILETRYSLDGGLTYVPYPGQVVLTVDGVRTVTFSSIDTAGNAEAPKSLEVKIDRLAPETAILSGPPSPTHDRDATFSFASPEAGTSFECSLDAGAFASCTSPATYAALAYGPHAFSVRAVDAAGNADPSPATRAWTVNPAATANVTFLRHTVGQGSNPGSSKAPVVSASVKAFSRASGSCASNIGVNPHAYGTILDTCAPDGSGTTDGSGLAAVGVAPGDYLLLARDPQTGVVSGVPSGNLALGDVTAKFLQVIVRANGTSVPAKTTTHVGSLLHVIEPEYIEWDQVQELYPFVFDAPEGEWSVIVTVTPPEGFTADYPSLSTEVDDDYKALQFTLTDIGSCWECGTGVDIEIRHEGRTLRQRHDVRTPMTERFVKRKGLTVEEMEARGVHVKRKVK